MIAYTGRWWIDGEKFVTQVDGAWDPGWVGTEQVRHFVFDGHTEGYSGGWFVMRSLFLITESPYNKDDLFVKGFSYHTTSQEQAIACIIPPGSIVKKSLTSASG